VDSFNHGGGAKDSTAGAAHDVAKEFSFNQGGGGANVLSVIVTVVVSCCVVNEGGGAKELSAIEALVVSWSGVIIIFTGEVVEDVGSIASEVAEGEGGAEWEEELLDVFLVMLAVRFLMLLSVRALVVRCDLICCMSL